MQPQAPLLVQHGSPRGKQKFLHDARSHDPPPNGLLGGLLMVLAGLDPVVGSVDPEPELLLGTQFPKLHTEFVEEQSVQGLPACPHALSSIPLAHMPLLQQPFGQEPAPQAWLAFAVGTVEPPLLPSSPPAGVLMPAPPLPALGVPPLALPALPLSPAARRPPPASSSIRRTLRGGSPSAPPVAQATTMNPPPSKSAPCVTPRLPKSIHRLLPTVARGTRHPSLQTAWLCPNRLAGDKMR